MLAIDPKPSGRLIGIDVLRGVAVLAVLVSHLPFSMRGLGAPAGDVSSIFPPQPFPMVAEYGRLGVQLFLVISGFCIHLKWARNADVHTRIEFFPFWRRRLTRLYPPYFVALCGALLATFVVNSVLQSPAPGLGAAFGYEETWTFVVDMFLLVFMLQNLTPAPWRIGNGPFWSLALEEQLYLLYFPLLWMRRHWGWGATFAVAAVATIVWRLAGAALFEQPPFFWFIVGPAFWLPWAFGAYAVEVYFGHVRLPSLARKWWMGVLLFATGVACNPPRELEIGRGIFGRTFDDLFYAAAFFVLVNIVVELESTGRLKPNLAIRALTKVGLWSYAIYLVHLLAMVPIKQVLVEVGAPPELITVVRLSAGLAVGYVFFRLVEVPFHRVARRFKAGLVDDRA